MTPFYIIGNTVSSKIWRHLCPICIFFTLRFYTRLAYHFDNHTTKYNTI